jgi:putative flippase GtrA
MLAMLMGRLPGVARVTYIRYILASAGALAVDLGLFMLLLAGGAPATPASTVSYAAGILVHWLLSSRAVFSDGLADRGADRHRQKILFLGSALVGLMITAAVVALCGMAGLDPRLAKLIAIVIAFQATYILRNTVVFS